MNIGMFHYHFRTREAFLRAVMQSAYEEMFSRLTLGIAKEATATANLRAALRALGRFVQDNRALIARILADALGGDAIAREFLKDNFPRHLGVLLMLVAAGQRAGELRPMAATQAIGFCAGALVLPILVGGSVAESGALDPAFAEGLRADMLTERALDERIDLALAALVASGAKRKRRGGTP